MPLASAVADTAVRTALNPPAGALQAGIPAGIGKAAPGGKSSLPARLRLREAYDYTARVTFPLRRQRVQA